MFIVVNSLRFDEETKEMCLMNIIPEVKLATAHIVLTKEKKSELFSKIVGIFMEFLYALVYQVRTRI